MRNKWFLILAFVFVAIGRSQGQMTADSAMNEMKHMPALLPMNSMSRGGSGTSWLPDSSPMHMWMFGKDKWQWMIHGMLYGIYNDQNIFREDTLRGDSKIYGSGMLMLMGDYQINNNWLFGTKFMVAPDPFSVADGYPLLFQTGETTDGKPNVDRQHPHDLFDEIAITLGYQITDQTGVYVYAGYPGEPALGPCAFPHRPSADDMPDAPLGHHWQDASHITFGVVTLGFQFDNFKIEGSLFNGSEPDENRYNFDSLKLNSYSGRISFNPSPSLSFQFSSGFLKRPELLETTDQVRTTASVIYVHHNFSLSAVAGDNAFSNNTNASSFLVEAANDFNDISIFGRYEFVQKNTEELNIQSVDEFVNVNAISLGLAHYFNFNSTMLGIGGQVSANPFLNETLRLYYGDFPVSGEIFLSLKPKFNMHEDHSMDHMKM